MDIGAGLIVAMVVMMTVMVGLVGAGIWVAGWRGSRHAEVDSREEDSSRRREE